MEMRLRLPVGIDSFEKLRKGNYYYVDKTALIEQALEKGSEVTLFTRPRRFGKSLNMSMLKSFFEIGTDPTLFTGLHISQNTELCEKYMGNILSKRNQCIFLQNHRLPVGIEDFAEIRRNEYYYVDKTQLIEQVLDRRNKVTLFTRPRRFGKTLNMSMLRYFFEIGTDVKLFEELFIAQNHELCEKYMGKYPVIAISLKGINASSYEAAFDQLVELINQSASDFQFLQNSNFLTDYEKERFARLLDDEMNRA